MERSVGVHAACGFNLNRGVRYAVRFTQSLFDGLEGKRAVADVFDRDMERHQRALAGQKPHMHVVNVGQARHMAQQICLESNKVKIVRRSFH